MKKPSTLLCLLLPLLLIMAGCATPPSAYRAPTAADRNPIKAQELTMRAADIMHEDPARAESLLREALAFDVFHGPAHNNLGVLHLERGELYEAANEFEWARKLMPGHPDPRLNLGLTLERAGRIDEALGTYETALEVYPNHLPTLQAICRCQLRNNRADESTGAWLAEIALRGESEAWRDWARLHLAKLRR